MSGGRVRSELRPRRCHGERPWRHRMVSLTVATGLAATGLAACADDGPGPDRAATVLASGLSSLDLAAVPFTEATSADANQQLAAVV